MKFFPGVLLALVSAASAVAWPASDGPQKPGIIFSGVSAHVDIEARYLFYLHGYIVQDKDPRPVSPRFGVYEYEKILHTFRDEGFNVVSEARTQSREIEPYARKVTGEIRRLLQAGVPPKHITVVGASQGSWIAMLVSTQLKNRGLNFVFIAACSADEDFLNTIDLHGNVLSIYEKSDLPQGCERYRQDATGIRDWKEVELNTGLRHGFIYRPMKEWVGPAVAWAKR